MKYNPFFLLFFLDLYKVLQVMEVCRIVLYTALQTILRNYTLNTLNRVLSSHTSELSLYTELIVALNKLLNVWVFAKYRV